MDTRLRTKLRAGGSRMHYQQFDYSTSGTDDELSEVMFLVPPDPVDADRMEPEVPFVYLNYSVTMSVRALRHHEYLLPKSSPPYWEHQPHC